MKKLLLITAILGMGLLSHAQITFEKNYDAGFLDSDEAHCLIQTSDGGYLMSGAAWAGDEAWYDICLIKTDENGAWEWAKTFGEGEYNIEIGSAVVETGDGGYWIAGNTDGVSGNDDFWAIKTDANGEEVWSAVYGGDGQEFVSGGTKTNDGGYILVGSTNSYGVGGDDVYIVKTDAEGNKLWTKTYGTDEMDYANDVQQTTDGGYIIAGAVNGYQDGYLIRTDANGDSLWTRVFGGPLTEEFFSVKQTGDGGFIVSGKNMSEGAGDYDVWLVKVDADGEEQWSKVFGGEKKDQGFSVSITDDAGYFIVGYTESFAHADEDSDMYWIKTNDNGDTLWTKSFGDIMDDGGLSGLQTEDGGLVAAGYMYVSGEQLNYYLVKMTEDGTVDINTMTVVEDDIKVFPNPVVDRTTIEFPNPNAALFSLTITDINGRIVKRDASIAGNKFVVERGGLKSGLYFITVKGERTFRTRVMFK